MPAEQANVVMVLARQSVWTEVENPRGLSDLALVQELAKTMDWDEVTSLADEQGQDPVVCFYVVPDGYVANEEFLFTARIKQ